MFDSADDVEQTRKDLCWWMEALTQRNQDYLRQRPNTPRLYKSGVVYDAPQQFSGDCETVKVLRNAIPRGAASQRDVRRALELVQAVLGGEHFCDIGVILELGKIDCDGMACWRAAELRQGGIPARPYMTHRDRLGGGTVYHALDLWPPMPTCPYVTSEDPSMLLGMGGPGRSAERQEEIRKNQERCEILAAMKQGRLARPAPDDLESALDGILGFRQRDVTRVLRSA